MKTMKHHWVSGLLMVTVALAWAVAGQAADSIMITAVDADKGVVTVKNNTTGETREVQVGDPKLLEGLTVGQVIEAPKDAEVQSRAATKPPTKFTDSESCLPRCLSAGASTRPVCTIAWFPNNKKGTIHSRSGRSRAHLRART